MAPTEIFYKVYFLLLFSYYFLNLIKRIICFCVRHNERSALNNVLSHRIHVFLPIDHAMDSVIMNPIVIIDEYNDCCSQCCSWCELESMHLTSAKVLYNQVKWNSSYVVQSTVFILQNTIRLLHAALPAVIGANFQALSKVLFISIISPIVRKKVTDQPVKSKVQVSSLLRNTIHCSICAISDDSNCQINKTKLTASTLDYYWNLN